MVKQLLCSLKFIIKFSTSISKFKSHVIEETLLIYNFLYLFLFYSYILLFISDKFYYIIGKKWLKTLKKRKAKLTFIVIVLNFETYLENGRTHVSSLIDVILTTYNPTTFLITCFMHFVKG